MNTDGGTKQRRSRKKIDAALVFFFNHRFDRNIPRLRDLYRHRFSTIRFIVPFYNGADPDVIPVHENSFNFSGFFAQASRELAELDVRNFLFVADDAFLHPGLNEVNFSDFFQPEKNWAYISKLDWFDEERTFWSQTREALVWEPLTRQGVEIASELPSVSEATDLLLRHGLSSRKVNWGRITPNPFQMRSLLANFPRFIYLLASAIMTIGSIFFQPKPRLSLKYPLVGGYSDVFAVSRNCLEEFGRLCGVFAAARLHSEIAVPTALCLACERITQDKDLRFAAEVIWPDSKGGLGRLDLLGSSLRLLQSSWPPTSLFVHPVKLSKWTS